MIGAHWKLQRICRTVRGRRKEGRKDTRRLVGIMGEVFGITENRQNYRRICRKSKCRNKRGT